MRGRVRDTVEVGAWIERQKKVLIEAIAMGQVLVN